MNGNFQTPCHHILLSHTIEDDVNRRYENFPHAIHTEKVSQHIEVFSLQCRCPTLALLHIAQWVHFQEQLTWQFFQRGNFQSQLTDIWNVKGAEWINESLKRTAVTVNLLSEPGGRWVTLLIMPHNPLEVFVGLFRRLSIAIRFFFVKIISIVSISRRSNIITSLWLTGLNWHQIWGKLNLANKQTRKDQILPNEVRHACVWIIYRTEAR